LITTSQRKRSHTKDSFGSFTVNRTLAFGAFDRHKGVA
jgi:hypothetical protein